MIILGLGFGDEGKGLTTSYLCSKTENPITVRFNGGHQAGHTVVFNKYRHVFSSFGSGTLQGVPTYWSKYCTLYPMALRNEFNLLKVIPELFVDPLCPITTPYDVRYNRQLNDKHCHGSVGVGFGTTIARHEVGYKLFAQDLFNDVVLAIKLETIKNYYIDKGLEDIPINLEPYIIAIRQCRSIIKLSDYSIIAKYNPIYEGAQGILLDQNFGFFPHVTRSNTTSKNALQLDNRTKEIFYVTRSYSTRHGNGYHSKTKTLIKLKNNKHETNVSNYQGEFRISVLDINLMNYALDCDNHFSKYLKKNLVVTCLDQYSINVSNLVEKLHTKFDKIFISTGDSLDNIREL